MKKFDCILSEALPMGADGELPFWAAVIVTGAVDAKSSYESSLSKPETPSPSKMSLEPPPRRSRAAHRSFINWTMARSLLALRHFTASLKPSLPPRYSAS